MLALRQRRMRVNMEDFRKAKETVMSQKKNNASEAFYN